MIQVQLLKRVILLLLVIYILHYIGGVFYFHSIYWWYDVSLHFMAGFSIGMAFLIGWFFLFSSKSISKEKLVILSIVVTFIIGFLWEVFEIQMGFTSFEDGIYYWRDTISDFIIDCVGGFLGALYSFKFFPGKINK